MRQIEEKFANLAEFVCIYQLFFVPLQPETSKMCIEKQIGVSGKCVVKRIC